MKGAHDDQNAALGKTGPSSSQRERGFLGTLTFLVRSGGLGGQGALKGSISISTQRASRSASLLSLFLFPLSNLNDKFLGGQGLVKCQAQ